MSDEGAAGTSGASLPDESVWQGMLRQLTLYHRAHGHCFVPLRCREHPRLGAWLAEQSALFHKKRLTPERQRALEGLGFECISANIAARPNASFVLVLLLVLVLEATQLVVPWQFEDE